MGKLLEDARDRSRSGSLVLALMEGEDADVPLLPSSSGGPQPAEWPGEGVAVAFGKREFEELVERLLAQCEYYGNRIVDRVIVQLKKQEGRRALAQR